MASSSCCGANSQPLAQFDRRGLVVQPQQDDVHGAVNLWTELSWFAAQTLITTRKARLDKINGSTAAQADLPADEQHG